MTQPELVPAPESPPEAPKPAPAPEPMPAAAALDPRMEELKEAIKRVQSQIMQTTLELGDFTYRAKKRSDTLDNLNKAMSELKMELMQTANG